MVGAELQEESAEQQVRRMLLNEKGSLARKREGRDEDLDNTEPIKCKLTEPKKEDSHAVQRTLRFHGKHGCSS
jgi:hypothetical protein